MSDPALELPKDVKKKLGELEALSDKAKGGDKDARRELRKAVRESSPEVIAQVSSFARKVQTIAVQAASGTDDPLMEEALTARLELMRQEIAGENPTPLEVLLSERVLLAERVVAYWLLATHLDGLISIQLHPTLGKEHRAPESFFMRMVGWQESVNKRYLSAIKELAQVRKLQSNAPGIQVNTQVNLLGGRRAVQRSAKEEEES